MKRTVVTVAAAMAAAVLATAPAALGQSPGSTGPAGSSPGTTPPSTAAGSTALAGGTAAGGKALAEPTSIMDFDAAQAAALNQPQTDADSLRICGNDDGSRFLAEILAGNPLAYKIPWRLGDVVAGNAKPTATFGHQYVAAGIAGDLHAPSGSGDFPFDHPFGSDFNMDVALDPAYAFLSQLGGLPTANPQHTELGGGNFPHNPVQPAADDTWPSYSAQAAANIHPGYVPTPGDRVLVMGRWVNDCGHPPFATELHPISFLANAHVQGNRTVAQAMYAPYRETQQYHPDLPVANDVYDIARYFSPNDYGFPAGLITSILRIQDAGPAGYESIDHFESWQMIEANRTSPPDWRICAPPGSVGQYVGANWDVVARPGVDLKVYADHVNGCVVVHADISQQTTPTPTPKVCRLPWDFLNQVAAAEAGSPSLDLKAEIKKYVAPQFQSRVDPDPIMNCYDAVQGPVVSATPQGQDVTTNSQTEAPFYGRIEVFRTDTAPTIPDLPSTTSSSSTTSSGSTSSLPTGESITVSPASVRPGGTIDVRSTGWKAGSPVTITLNGTTLGTLNAGTDGVVQGTFTVPSAAALGTATVGADGTGSAGAALRLQTTITIVSGSGSGATGSLPTTGADIARIVFFASLAVLVGLGLVGIAASRRRIPIRD